MVIPPVETINPEAIVEVALPERVEVAVPFAAEVRVVEALLVKNSFQVEVAVPES